MRRKSVLFEPLESRRLLTAYSPAQIESAYNFNNITFNNGSVIGNGAGQTIALIEVDHSSTLNTDLANFDSAFHLQNPGPTTWNLTVVGQDGGAVPSTPTGTSENLETALDVEWAHAIAPAANILVVEANSGNDSDLNVAVNTASTATGVSVVSSSYTRGEFSTDPGNSPYVAPANHNGVTFVAAAGDSPEVMYPAASSNVVGVGGTSLTLANNAYGSETVWNDQYGKTGAGVSMYWTEPDYQLAVQKTGFRTVADVGYDADPLTGFITWFNGSSTPVSAGGTSAGAPQWAALFAIADQGRDLNQLDTLDSGTQTLPMLYALYGTPYYSQAFNDVTTGNNIRFSAGPGYDYPTGLGTPNAGFLVQYLAGNISIPEPSSMALILVGSALLLKRRSRSSTRGKKAQFSPAYPEKFATKKSPRKALL
jgi:subtilase family serine protease